MERKGFRVAMVVGVILIAILMGQARASDFRIFLDKPCYKDCYRKCRKYLDIYICRAYCFTDCTYLQYPIPFSTVNSTGLYPRVDTLNRVMKGEDCLKSCPNKCNKE